MSEEAEIKLPTSVAAVAAAKSLQSCPTLCDPIDSSPPGSAVPGILQARTLEWIAIVFSNAWKWKMKGKSLSRVQLFATPWTAAYQTPPSIGFSRQEYWSGLPLPSPLDHQKSKSSRKPSTSALLIMPKPLTVCFTTNCGKFFKRWEYQTTLPASWETCMQVKNHQLELDMEQQTGSNLGKEYVKAEYCHPAYLTSMQSTSCKMPDWMKHKLESRLPGEVSITSDTQMTPLLWQSEEDLKSHLMKVKASEKAGLKLNIQKTKIMASGLIISWQANEETMETVTDYFLGLQNHCRW